MTLTLKDSILPEFDHEMAVTRRVLERVPLDQGDWRPHPRSMSIGQLSTHLAEIPGWINTLLESSGYDLGTVGTDNHQFRYRTMEALLGEFDRNVDRARVLIASKTDPELLAPWTLRRNGTELYTMPKVSVVRSFLMNHSIHHRGQLSVFLRMRDVAIPSMYGPSADEIGL